MSLGRPKRSTAGTHANKHKQEENVLEAEIAAKNGRKPKRKLPETASAVAPKKKTKTIVTTEPKKKPPKPPLPPPPPVPTEVVPPPLPPPPPPVLTKSEMEGVAKAEKTAKRKEAAAKKKAATEGVNKTKALLHQRVIMEKNIHDNDVRADVPPDRKAFINVETCAVSVGAYVSVSNDPKTDGVSGWGGTGWVDKAAGYGAATICDVKVEGKLLRDVVLGRITSPVLTT